MPVTCDTTGVWSLDDVYKKAVNGRWRFYNGTNDPAGCLFAAGVLNFGQLGNNSSVTLYLSSPTAIPGTTWTDIGKSLYSVRALKGDGTLWSWGYNASGELGINTVLSASSPTQVPGTNWCCIAGDNNCAGSTAGALKTDGTLWTWGCNGNGMLGNNNIAPASSPIQVPGTTWCDLKIEHCHSLALKTDGSLWTWGNNAQGYLGQNDTICRSSPIQIPGTWSSISVGNRFSHAIKTDGTLWAWGIGYYGQLGNNTGTFGLYYSSPIQIPGTTWVEVNGGFEHTLARKSDGTLWVWGSNNSGALGLNTPVATCVSSPIQIPGTNWTSMDAVCHSSFAIKSDGTLWVWGKNTVGQLGYCCKCPISSPTQIPGTNWAQVCSGRESTFLRKWI